MRLSWAGDNYGGFQASDEFVGAADDEIRKLYGKKILDSCEGCSNVLRAAASKAANRIVARIKRRTEKNEREARIAELEEAILEYADSEAADTVTADERERATMRKRFAYAEQRLLDLGRAIGSKRGIKK